MSVNQAFNLPEPFLTYNQALHLSVIVQNKKFTKDTGTPETVQGASTEVDGT